MTIEELLRTSKTIAVVGLSPRRMRPSYGVSEYMQANGYRIIPVNPAVAGHSEILGEKVYAMLEDIPVPVDIVDVFRTPEAVPEVVESAIRIGARAVWMQEGVTHEEAAKRAESKGIFVVQDLCILKEHLKLK
jgi:predicted CoA-binding protein